MLEPGEAVPGSLQGPEFSPQHREKDTRSTASHKKNTNDRREAAVAMLVG